MNKKGFLRIVEASVAILIIAAALFVFFNQQRPPSDPDYTERARDILTEISQEPLLRQAVLQEDNLTIELFVEAKVPENFLLQEVRICDIDSACGKTTYTPQNVYSAERVISSTIENLGPKKIRVFIWETS